jgi:hypothetical protein
MSNESPRAYARDYDYIHRRSLAKAKKAFDQKLEAEKAARRKTGQEGDKDKEKD